MLYSHVCNKNRHLSAVLNGVRRNVHGTSGTTGCNKTSSSSSSRSHSCSRQLDSISKFPRRLRERVTNLMTDFAPVHSVEPRYMFAFCQSSVASLVFCVSRMACRALNFLFSSALHFTSHPLGGVFQCVLVYCVTLNIELYKRSLID